MTSNFIIFNKIIFLSDQNERSQNNCLNCNARVYGKYCHICGQKNVEPFETVWHLVTHFFKDITHFDGKFFSTLRYLITKPGFLSTEYRIGRRANYLNPVRLYLFTSAIFFLIFFSLSGMTNNMVKHEYRGRSAEDVTAMDSASFNNYTRTLNNNKPMTRGDFKIYVDSANSKTSLRFTSGKYQTRAAYDSAIRSGKVDDNWFVRKWVYKEIDINAKLKEDQSLVFKSFSDTLLHSFPQMLFISLPLIALALKLLYRRQKEYYYASHLIFSIHLYVFVFIIFLMIIGLDKAKDFTNWNFIDYLHGVAVCSIFYYTYRAMRNFYEQGRGKTLLKYLLLNLLMLLIVFLLFMFFIFVSILKV